MDQPPNSLSARIDALNIAIGKLAAWLTLLMVIVSLVVVVLRYVFDLGFIWMQEGLTWMHAAVFMLGAAYTLQQDEHVRVDIFYRGMAPTGRALVNILGVLLFVLPIGFFLVYESWGYVAAAWRIGEISRDTGGLPYPAIPMLKSMLLAMPVLVCLQGISLLLNSLVTLKGER